MLVTQNLIMCFQEKYKKIQLKSFASQMISFRSTLNVDRTERPVVLLSCRTVGLQCSITMGPFFDTYGIF